jgi:putative ABC transport system ATP-binding protein
VVHALSGIDLTINKGELVAIMGPSGSGKSTLLNMLGLLDEPTAGQILIQGRNITAIKARELPNIRSKELGFVFQSFNLVTTLTALENVMIPLRYAGIGLLKRREMAKNALEQVGLGDRLSHSPNELSGGQQQRVAIARSIVNKPSIIFGDELTGELDSKMTIEVMELIKRLNKNGQTFIIVTHNPDVAKMCKRIIYMKDGRIEKEVIHSKK